LIKRILILIGLATILTIFMVFSGCTSHQWRMDDRYPLGENDFLLFESKEGGGLETFRISKSGYAEKSGNKDLYKSGTLSEEDMTELYEYIKESGFFRLRGTYRYIYNLGNYLEYFGMSIRGEDEIKTVYAYSELPDPFSDVLGYLSKEVEPKLQDEIRHGTYIMAEMTESLRYENVISEEDLKAHPFLEQAINNLGWFVYVGSIDDTKLMDYITPGKDYFCINLEGEKFCIWVYEQQK